MAAKFLILDSNIVVIAVAYMEANRIPVFLVQLLLFMAPLKRQGASSAALKHLAFLRGEKAPQGAAKAAKAHTKGAWARVDPLGEKKNDRRLPLSSAGFPQETGIVHLIDTPPSNNSNPSGNGDQMPGSSEGDETSREIDECREALHRLDEAAETALGLCTKLGVLEVTGRQSGGCRTELLSLMADTLPSIMEKVQILANLGQSGNEISGSRYKPEGLDLEPMIERFAESLSHRALELLKTKL
ncbi:hypothetical protein Taro_034272 [Colocasia esculenta]|uniref:Uncharacterized protein n=1 Tax=Colocasia esculenta TaxID=4460 RepID=A0A843VW05_COLES|nr:hypothetical protein [Colocasia esculenta]